jgi:hypothetical protein
MDIDTDTENKVEQSEYLEESTAIECQCTCEGECQCGKYRRPVYYEVDVNQYINSLNDWD